MAGILDNCQMEDILDSSAGTCFVVVVVVAAVAGTYLVVVGDTVVAVVNIVAAGRILVVEDTVVGRIVVALVAVVVVAAVAVLASKMMLLVVELVEDFGESVAVPVFVSLQAGVSRLVAIFSISPACDVPLVYSLRVQSCDRLSSKAIFSTGLKPRVLSFYLFSLGSTS